ncbi:organic cation transporter protein [Rhipicephalus sanguineus]|uniref:organic cation transporter protein n=1 Tax=Rhipicephalus sanguineus TaxID=34632 RepID=UPI0018933645|nr:organic cation transporter protein [Rhipicephalus sanguineus]
MTEVVDLIGHFGPWQACFVAFVTYRGILTGFNNLAFVFLATDNEHWCSRPTLPDGLLANISDSEWKERFIPYNNNDSESYSQCSMYGLLQNSTTGEIVPDYTSLKSCEAWTYDEHVFGHTATDEWNLVCENTWKKSLMQSTYMACMMLAVLLIGNVSDRFGRRIVAVFSIICLCVSASALTFSSSLNFFLVARIGVAFAISGLQVACFSLLAETIGPKFRIALNVCYGYGWIIGLLLLPGIVWLAQDWRKLLIVQAAFSVSLLFALPWLYESPRWLVSVGKQAEAVEAIRKIARFNKKQLGDVEKEVEGLMKRKLNAMQGHQSNVSVIGLFKTKYLRRNTLVLVTVSFLSSIVYYGFSRTATTLGGNPYLNFGIAAALECTGYTVSLVTTKYLKRIPTMFSSYGFFSLTLLITAFTPREYLVLRTTIRMAGWFTYTLGYTTQFVFENEMFPTVARSGGFGLCSTIGRLGATLEPWINVFLMSWGEKVVLILYSAMLFVISCAMILFPETLGSPLPDTLEEGELYSALKLSKKMKNASKNKDLYDIVQADDREVENKI